MARSGGTRGLTVALGALAAVALASCRPFEVAKTPDDALVELTADRFPAFSDDLDFEKLDLAIDRSLKHFEGLAKREPAKRLAFGTERVPASRVAETLKDFRALVATHPTPEALRTAMAARYRVFQSTGNNRERDVLFTGYYLPALEAADAKDDAHPWPLYGPPTDLVTLKAKDFPGLSEDLVGRVIAGEFKPYATRAEIDRGAVPADRAVAWVSSAIDAFFLEVQGSGVLRYPDGTTRIATFAGRNGQPYAAIGGELVKRGELARAAVSMQSIRAWLEAHPDARAEVMQANPSYVFFRLAPDAMGSLAVPVTGGRTLATDFRVFPKGALCFVETTRPLADGRTEPVARFMLDQDTGGAIRTAGHVDFFFGEGEDAAQAAGLMKQPGRLFYLLLR